LARGNEKVGAAYPGTRTVRHQLQTGGRLCARRFLRKSFIEVHSHHHESFFQQTDDKDEQGFRLYGVLGTIFNRPTCGYGSASTASSGKSRPKTFSNWVNLARIGLILDAYFDDDQKMGKVVEEEVEGA
jgi:hypothetical protein